MSFSTSVPVLKFESQNEVDEKKKLRQEEWEKVRKPDEPEVCPEAPVDNRCLYDKLEEQRLKKQEEFDDKVAFKNQVHRLDEDETVFLDFCSERQLEIKDERRQEEQRIITEMKDSRVVKVEEKVNKTEEKKPRSTNASKKSQMSLLAGAVKRKSSTEDVSPTKKVKTDDKTGSDADCESQSTSSKSQPTVTSTNGGIAKVVAVLPRALAGLTDYADSSDSLSSSSDESEPDFSLSGRNAAMRAMQAARQHVQQQQHQ